MCEQYLNVYLKGGSGQSRANSWLCMKVKPSLFYLIGVIYLILHRCLDSIKTCIHALNEF